MHGYIDQRLLLAKNILLELNTNEFESMLQTPPPLVKVLTKENEFPKVFNSDVDVNKDGNPDFKVSISNNDLENYIPIITKTAINPEFNGKEDNLQITISSDQMKIEGNYSYDPDGINGPQSPVPAKTDLIWHSQYTKRFILSLKPTDDKAVNTCLTCLPGIDIPEQIVATTLPRNKDEALAKIAEIAAERVRINGGELLEVCALSSHGNGTDIEYECGKGRTEFLNVTDVTRTLIPFMKPNDKSALLLFVCKAAEDKKNVAKIDLLTSNPAYKDVSVFISTTDVGGVDNTSGKDNVLFTQKIRYFDMDLVIANDGLLRFRNGTHVAMPHEFVYLVPKGTAGGYTNASLGISNSLSDTNNTTSAKK